MKAYQRSSCLSDADIPPVFTRTMDIVTLQTNPLIRLIPIPPMHSLKGSGAFLVALSFNY